MTCGKTEGELYAVLDATNQTLRDLPRVDDRREKAGTAYHDAYAAWKSHVSEPITGLGVTRAEAGGFHFELTERGVKTTGMPEDLSTDKRVALAAERIWDRERPRRTMNPDTEAACDAAKLAGLPVLIAEIKRLRDQAS